MKIYRGFNEPQNCSELENIFRNKPRTPINTSDLLHETADEWFFEKFGVPARSTTIICSTDISQARSYGATYRITPIGPHKIIYSKEIRDFHEIAARFPEGENFHAPEIREWLERNSYISVDDYSKIENGFLGEVMLDCDRFKIEKT